jgi:hypothetical protein
VFGEELGAIGMPIGGVWRGGRAVIRVETL